jgi:hypothetical protein
MRGKCSRETLAGASELSNGAATVGNAPMTVNNLSELGTS